MQRGEKTRQVRDAILKPNGRTDVQIARELGTTTDYLYQVRRDLKTRGNSVPRRSDLPARQNTDPRDDTIPEGLRLVVVPEEAARPEDIRGVRLVSVRLTDPPRREPRSEPEPEEDEEETECTGCGTVFVGEASHCPGCGGAFS